MNAERSWKSIGKTSHPGGDDGDDRILRAQILRAQILRVRILRVRIHRVRIRHGDQSGGRDGDDGDRQKEGPKDSGALGGCPPPW